MKDTHLQILFFDGVCHLCNGVVDFIIQNEKEPGRLIFAPLQGSTAAKYLAENQRQKLQSVVFFDNGDFYEEFPAVVRLLPHLKFPWRLFAAPAHFIPTFLGNFFYRLVARNRYQWFGTREHCRLPSPEEKSQLWP